MKPFLLLVDLQHDFLSDEGLDPGAGVIVANVQRLLHEFRERDLPVFHVRTVVDPEADNRMPHWKSAGLWRCVRGSKGVRAPETIDAIENEIVLEKTFFSPFAGGRLDMLLADMDLDTVVVAGLHLHACVRQTILDAYQRSLHCVVVDGAVGSYDPLHATMSRQYLEGRAARFLSIEQLVALMGNRSAPARGLLDESEACVHRSPRDVRDTWRFEDTAAGEIGRLTRVAKAALDEWQSIDIPGRAGILRSTISNLDERRSDLAELVARQVGKPIQMARAEVASCCDAIEAVLKRFVDHRESNFVDDQIRRRPPGVVAIITPWNNPLYIPLGKIVPALLFGNAVVWKPSPAANECARRLAGAFHDAGLPTELLQLVFGGAATSRWLMRDAAVAAVSLTGSSAAGYEAQVVCARRRIPLQAELGGNNAAVVWHDADVRSAAQQVAAGAFAFAGQRCTANRRAVVHESVLPAFVEAVLESTAKLVWGDPLAEDTVVGPVISVEKRLAVAALLERVPGASRNVNRIRDGLRLSEQALGRGSYMPPTVVRCDDPDEEAVQEETFAPVLVVQRATDWGHAMQLCNGVRQGLAASLFSPDSDLWERFQAEADAGILKLNQPTAGAAVDVPFGGWRASGVGPPEHGQTDLDFYTRIQTIYE